MERYVVTESRKRSQTDVNIPQTMSTLQSLLPRVSVGQGYGATECTAMVAAFDGRDSSFPGGSAGILCPNVE